MPSWGRLAVGDVISVRGKRSAVQRTVTVAKLLDPVPPDGRGFEGDDGETYRYFYWDVRPAPKERQTTSRPNALPTSSSSTARLGSVQTSLRILDTDIEGLIERAAKGDIHTVRTPTGRLVLYLTEE